MMKSKLKDEYSHLKPWPMCNISCELDSVSFVSRYCLVSVIFFCYFRLLKFAIKKNTLNTVYAGDRIQHKRLPVSLEVVKIHLQSLDLSI